MTTGQSFEHTPTGPAGKGDHSVVRELAASDQLEPTTLPAITSAPRPPASATRRFTRLIDVDAPGRLDLQRTAGTMVLSIQIDEAAYRNVATGRQQQYRSPIREAIAILDRTRNAIPLNSGARFELNAAASDH